MHSIFMILASGQSANVATMRSLLAVLLFSVFVVTPQETEAGVSFPLVIPYEWDRGYFQGSATFTLEDDGTCVTEKNGQVNKGTWTYTKSSGRLDLDFNWTTWHGKRVDSTRCLDGVIRDNGNDVGVWSGCVQ